jgi:hypothetical protein
MRGTIIGMAAVAVIAASVPAAAEDFYVRAPGVSIGVNDGYRDRGYDYRERRVIRDRSFARGECRTTIIKRDGYTKKIRRCD